MIRDFDRGALVKLAVYKQSKSLQCSKINTQTVPRDRIFKNLTIRLVYDWLPKIWEIRVARLEDFMAVSENKA